MLARQEAQGSASKIFPRTSTSFEVRQNAKPSAGYISTTSPTICFVRKAVGLADQRSAHPVRFPEQAQSLDRCSSDPSQARRYCVSQTTYPRARRRSKTFIAISIISSLFDALANVSGGFILGRVGSPLLERHSIVWGRHRRAPRRRSRRRKPERATGYSRGRCA